MKPDLVILDMSMPGMGGLTFMRQMSTDTGADVPVLVYTAYPREMTTEMENVAGLLLKPATVDRLVAEVEKILGTGDDPDHPPAPIIRPA